MGREAREGGRERREGERGREGWERGRGRDGGQGGARAKLGFPPSLPPSPHPSHPHCLLYFLKLYNVFNDNVQSIR